MTPAAGPESGWSSVHGRRLWQVVALVLVVMALGGGGAAGACKLLLDCHVRHPPITADTFRGHGGGPADLPGDLRMTTVVRGFHYPTDFAFLPDGRLLVAEKNGEIEVAGRDGDVDRTPFLDLRNLVSVEYFRGIMDISVDTDFDAHPYVYVVYSAPGSGIRARKPTVVRISRFTVDGDRADPASEKIIIGAAGSLSCFDVPRTADCLPSEVDLDGGEIVFAPDGTLFVGTGSGGGGNGVEPIMFRAPAIDTLGGKVLHVDRNGRGLPGNPFWNGDPDANRSKIWATGLRNPFRIALLPGRPQTLVVGDLGRKRWERLVRVTRGAELGWPCYEGPSRPDGYRASNFCVAYYRSHPKSPAQNWVVLRHPGARAVTGGVALAGATALPPHYRGDYVFGDWLKNRIFVVPVRAPRGSTPRLLSHNAGGPVTFAVGPDGALYYLAANLGEVRRISTATE